MPELIPPAFLVRFSIPVKRCGSPAKSGRLLPLTAQHRLASVEDMQPGQRFATVSCGWNEQGLGFRLEVRGKKTPPQCDLKQLDKADGLRLWLDMRNTNTIHRASRYCFHFQGMPVGFPTNPQEPHLVQTIIDRAREDAPMNRANTTRCWSEIVPGGYDYEVWFSSEAIPGYDPANQPKLGFYYSVHDAELGDQYLSVGPEFPYDRDPSLWWTLDLQQ